MRRPSIAIVLVIVLSVAAQGQTDTSSIPRELALALIGGDFRGAPSITIGRTPDGFAPGLIPANARVLGGATYQADRPTGMLASVTAIAVVADSAEPGLSRLAQSLDRKGWKPPAVPGRGGFASVTVGYGGPSMLLCDESSALMLSAKPRTGGGSTLQLTLSPAEICDPDRRDRERSARELPLPTLRPPTGVYSRGNGSGGSDNYREANTELVTSKGASELADHFARQLVEQGWTLGLRAADGNSVVQMASRMDEKGNSLNGVLGIISWPGTTTRYSWIRVVRERQRR